MINKLKKIFICGTNTDVGKTYIANRIIKKIKKKAKIGVYKPIESGCNKKCGELIPNDSSIYFKTIEEEIPLNIINPYRFEPPISPRRAIKLAKRKIYNKNLVSHIKQFSDYEYLFIEGAGGVCSPLTLDGLNIDFMKQIGGKAILIAKDELGVLNNVLLCLNILKKYKIPLLAIVLNRIHLKQHSKMNNKKELEEFTDIPVLQFIHNKSDDAELRFLEKKILTM